MPRLDTILHYLYQNLNKECKKILFLKKTNRTPNIIFSYFHVNYFGKIETRNIRECTRTDNFFIGPIEIACLILKNKKPPKMSKILKNSMKNLVWPMIVKVSIHKKRHILSCASEMPYFCVLAVSIGLGEHEGDSDRPIKQCCLVQKQI